MPRTVAALALALVAAPAPASAAQIFIRAESVQDSIAVDVRSKLTGLGHTVTVSATGQADYASYDQVWDLRYNSGITAPPVTHPDTPAYDAFLEQGGRMFVAADYSGFPARHRSIAPFVAAVGGGELTLVTSGDGQSGAQAVTLAGETVMPAHDTATLQFAAAGLIAGGTQGFAVTTLATGPQAGRGSVWAWDFGDLTGAADARLVLAMDVNVIDGRNGAKFIENLATYLGATAPAVPEPSTAILLAAATATALGRRK